MLRRRLTPLRAGGVGALAAASVLGAGLVSAPAHAVENETPTVTVVDPSALNWLWVTWNTMEELVRVDQNGRLVPNLARDWAWKDDNTTLEFKLREDVTFQDGEKFTAESVKQSFDQVQNWETPHPPGAFLNFAKDMEAEIIDEHTIAFHFPKPDAGALMKFRGMHIGSSRFWKEAGFKDEEGSAEGSW